LRGTLKKKKKKGKEEEGKREKKKKGIKEEPNEKYVALEWCTAQRTVVAQNAVAMVHTEIIMNYCSIKTALNIKRNTVAHVVPVSKANNS